MKINTESYSQKYLSKEAQKKEKCDGRYSCKDTISLGGGGGCAINNLKSILISIFPQNPILDKKPETYAVEGKMFDNGLKNKRFEVVDKDNPLAVPDENGNYNNISPDSPQFAQVQALVTSSETDAMLSEYAGRTPQWVCGDKPIRLQLNNDINGAFFSYDYINHSICPIRYCEGGKIQTALSDDTVSHETGHAFNSALRHNDYFLKDSRETKAFGEAFADCSLILHSLSHDKNIDGVFEETRGDLSRQNRIALCDEMWGYGKNLNSSPVSSALNQYKYKPAANMPWNPDYCDGIDTGWESHRYSKVFSGAFYDSLREIYERNLSENSPDALDRMKDGKLSKEEMKESLRAAGDTMGKIFTKAMDFGSPSNMTFKTAALGMLAADKVLNGGENQDVLKKAFLNKEILTPEQISYFEDRMSNLPDVKSDTPVNSGKDADEFLDKNSKKLKLNPEDFDKTKTEVIKDKYGYTYIRYFMTNEAMSKAIDDSRIYEPGSGGTTIALDDSGRLVSMMTDSSMDFLYNKAERKYFKK